MTGADIATEVAAGLAEVGVTCTIRKRAADTVGPWAADADTDDFAVTAYETSRKVRDGLGMTERRVRMLLIETTGAAPAKGDKVAIGVAPAAVTGDTVWARLGEVETKNFQGVAVLYKAMLEE